MQAIRCGVRPHSLNILMYHEPKTGLQAKFSAEYWPAITLLRGRLGLREITDEVVSSPEVQAMIRKVTVYPDPQISVATARVNIEVTLKDGRVLKEAYFPAKGATDNPLTRDELTAKFDECAEWGGVSRANAARAASFRSTQNSHSAPFSSHPASHSSAAARTRFPSAPCEHEFAYTACSKIGNSSRTDVPGVSFELTPQRPR